jgi:hypothetical protein
LEDKNKRIKRKKCATFEDAKNGINKKTEGRGQCGWQMTAALAITASNRLTIAS